MEEVQENVEQVSTENEHVETEEPTSEQAQPEQAPGPQYVTLEELGSLKQEVSELLEQVKRESQSLTDKNVSRLRKEISERTKALDNLLSDPEIAESLGENFDSFKRRKKAETVADYLADYKDPEPEKKQEPVQPKPLTPEQMMALPEVKQVMERFKIYPTDPEFVHPATTGSFEAWEAKIENATSRKNQRLAQQKSKPEPPPEPQERKVAPVSMGTGSGPQTPTPEQLLAGIQAAVKRGDRAEIQRLNEEMKRVVTG